MPITIEVPELQLEDLPEWCQLRGDAGWILENCRNSLEFRCAIFSVQSEQGQQQALDTGKPTFGSFPALNCGVAE
jgi:hypothetical protein